MQLEIPIPRTIFSVSQINNTIKRILQQQSQLRNVWVKGQVSNLSRPKSGHIYFSLKDESEIIKGVMFKGNASKLQFQLKDGEEVLVQGNIDIYTASSQYQIIISTIEPIGEGALQRAFEELKRKLADEGLFDDVHKKPIPKYPKKIGVITSSTGAAIQDIYQRIQKRYPIAELLLYPTLVQGDKAPRQIAKAIRAMNKRKDIDVLIVGRGGGSIEDLWAFNEEVVAQAIFASQVPIVSAVGHETDFTISDFVADYRCPTPTAAGEHVVPDKDELITQLEHVIERITNASQNRLGILNGVVKELYSKLSPERRRDAINNLSQSIDDLEAAYQRAITDKLKTESNNLQSMSARLHGVSPLATLERGYSISRNMSGEIITSSSQVSKGDELDVKLSKGSLRCTVDECLNK
ncbi:exodeoxyribonuclease VII large subunit [Candidatus Poribacteria bacterium]|nr:MAG: exodeoxyribonuclease VII large subunit [Candidatus Poribacteria bacterium]